MKSETNSTMELKIMKTHEKDDKNRLSAYVGKVAERMLHEYNILNEENMKRLTVEVDGQNHCYRLSGPTPLIEKILADAGTIEADMGEGQVLLLKPQTVEENIEYPKKKKGSRKDDVGPNKAVANIGGIHEDKVSRLSTRPPPPPLPSSPPSYAAELEYPPPATDDRAEHQARPREDWPDPMLLRPDLRQDNRAFLRVIHVRLHD